MRRLLIVIGVLILLAGLFWPWLGKLPFGRLPGDIVVDRPGLRLYFPLMTTIVVSALVSLVLWLIRR